MCLLALSLLVSGVLADDSDDASPFDDLALIANLFDARSNLHDLPLLSFAGNETSVGVMSSDSNRYAIARDQTGNGVTRR